MLQPSSIAADAGYYLSFAGNVTFKNAQNLRDALGVTPRERILVETEIGGRAALYEFISFRHSAASSQTRSEDNAQQN